MHVSFISLQPCVSHVTIHVYNIIYVSNKNIICYYIKVSGKETKNFLNVNNHFCVILRKNVCFGFFSPCLREMNVEDVNVSIHTSKSKVSNQN